MAQFFIHRPIFAWVIAIVIMLAGAMSIRNLPLEQYPDIAPPRVSISAIYTGASAKTVEESVTQVIEQQLKGLDNLIYMGSTSDASGSSRTTLTFNAGTNIDVAQVQVQNKLQQAMSRLPPAVQSRGVTVTKGGNDYLMIVSFTSPDPSVTQVDIGDYISSNLVDVISRVDGVGDVATFGTPYAMRVWMDPAKLEKYALMPSDVGSAINAQNAQVSAGQLGALPAVGGQQLNATITARSKLQSRAEFENIVLKVATDGSVVRLKDVARIELGAENLTITSRLNGRPGAGMGVVLADGANAMAVAEAVNAKIAELRPFFPYQLKPFTSYDTTPFVEASIDEVVKALAEAMVLVVLVMYLFLQNFRATLIPAIAVPVVLLGTFGVLSAAGYSINTLTMFGMVLAIGLLVDDAIVVVENVERVMSEEGLTPKEATRKSMAEITPALVGIALTLSAVFIPMAFFGGSTGVIYRQFSITVVSAMVLSVLVALTLTPALCATLLKPIPKGAHSPHGGVPRRGPLGWLDRFFAGFNRRFDRTADGYQRGVGRIVRRGGRMMLIYALIVGGMAVLFMRLPTSFLPNEDQGAMQVQITLPAGSSNTRLQAVMAEVQKYFAEQPDVVSFNSITGANGDQSSARGFVRLKTWSERQGPGQSADAIARKATRDLRRIRDARIFVVLPPAVRGLGANAGFNFQLKDLNGLGHAALVAARDQVLKLASGRPELSNVRSNNPDDTAQLGVSIDDAKAGALGLATADINSTLSSAIGGTYVNDFLNKGRVKRVYMQGDAPYRMLPQDIGPWTVRNNQGQMVPFSAFSSTNWTYGSPQLQRYNGSPSYEFVGDAAPGVSSGAAMAAVDEIMKQMPPGIGYEWTGASYQERLSGSQAPLLYAISILFVFLCLAALYESWSVPFSVILVVPLGIVGALLGIGIRGLSNDVYFQVGLLTTVGLASKNAILIVEFATQLQAAGRSVIDATLEAVRLRLRPILMTSLAFGFGVLPLAIGTGAGAGGRQAIGTAVLGGMVSATVLGIFFVPVFFVLIRGFFARRGARTGPDAAHPSAGTDAPPPSSPASGASA
ncbi:efflux RND transporter permease subunit [Paracidovorax citrulli]|uniref:efflux RND transporter permease subunit n=1 Tax=Paracidovorax citrulli TaxID=80869 RepID=UPI0005FBCD57|nr:efflux RND transporter permease subunit [Paracidovorax citrulli]UEG47826.1 multidrug efflux RND transporter permease subunit [Paracidovorax citrulli]UMT88929.1 multidrug efflux RND transporter permease subunit [Paracidovorax citrulli]UMT96351.1 multidrug efflux RND transporter permease subunit [Paracidovorax citrulli]WIY36332.1 efflux RND transporter permease subunit [Paracidovorax citrulli]SDL14186.1 hydrophobic/amphiphilic exporter-1, HAE1 family [Paracidovorax citrulli]